MRAVIWTDVFQFVIMIGGMAAIFIKVFWVIVTWWFTHLWRFTKTSRLQRQIVKSW